MLGELESADKARRDVGVRELDDNRIGYAALFGIKGVLNDLPDQLGEGGVAEVRARRVMDVFDARTPEGKTAILLWYSCGPSFPTLTIHRCVCHVYPRLGSDISARALRASSAIWPSFDMRCWR